MILWNKILNAESPKQDIKMWLRGATVKRGFKNKG